MLKHSMKDKYTLNRLYKSAKIADMKPHESVLDLGCGDPYILNYLPDDIIYTGIDQTGDELCHDLNTGLPNSVLDQTFNVIFMNEFIEHIENFRSLLMQCKKILAVGGRIIISTPSHNRIMFGEDPTHIHCFRKSNMYNLASVCGLQIDKIIGTYLGIPYIPMISSSQTILTGVIIYKLTTKSRAQAQRTP